jgi:hypothetical protein
MQYLSGDGQGQPNHFDLDSAEIIRAFFRKVAQGSGYLAPHFRRSFFKFRSCARFAI